MPGWGHVPPVGDPDQPRRLWRCGGTAVLCRDPGTCLSGSRRSDAGHTGRCCCRGGPGGSWAGRWRPDSQRSGDTPGLWARWSGGAGVRLQAHSPPQHPHTMPRHTPHRSSRDTHRSGYKYFAGACNPLQARDTPSPPGSCRWAETPQTRGSSGRIMAAQHGPCRLVSQRARAGCPSTAGVVLPEPRALPSPVLPPLPPHPPGTQRRPRHAGSQLAAGQTTSWAGCQGLAPIPPPRSLTLSALALAAQVGTGTLACRGVPRGAGLWRTPAPHRAGCRFNRSCSPCCSQPQHGGPCCRRGAQPLVHHHQ